MTTPSITTNAIEKCEAFHVHGTRICQLPKGHEGPHSIKGSLIYPQTTPHEYEANGRGYCKLCRCPVGNNIHATNASAINDLRNDADRLRLRNARLMAVLVETKRWFEAKPIRASLGGGHPLGVIRNAIKADENA